MRRAKDMPKNYKFHDDDNSEESCYESEGETEYYPEKTLVREHTPKQENFNPLMVKNHVQYLSLGIKMILILKKFIININFSRLFTLHKILN